MKRLVVAAVLAGAALIPASQAAAVPPTSAGGPLGSAACTVFGGSPFSSSCNFTGASGGLGYMGGSTAGFSLTHIQKVAICAEHVVTGFTAVVATDAQSTAQGPFNAGPGYNFIVNRVYTFTVKGQGWGAVGGPSTPGASVPAEPATPGPSNWAGAEDLTGGAKQGDSC
jgi:hypothetical protein